MMKRKLLLLIMSLLVVASLAVMLSGCGADDELDGKHIVTFEINGGVFNYGTSSTDTAIKYAYHPDTKIVDPLTINQNKISRNGYVFTGWYTSSDCKANEKWEFKGQSVTADITLYAGWELEVKHTFSVKYTDGDSETTLGTYDVKAGTVFEDWRHFADKRDGYTAFGFYSDPECTAPWDFSSVHPGGESDLDIPVYVRYIEGEWTLVDNADKFISAVKNGKNIYLTCDIDFGGEEINPRDLSEYNATLEGNEYKISSFSVSKSGTTFSPTLAIFGELGANADIRNVSFENVTYKLFDVVDRDDVTVKAAALAADMAEGATVTNVTVTGVLETNYAGELPRLCDVFCYDAESESILDGVSGFSANITVNKQ